MGRFSKYIGDAQEIVLEYSNGTKETLSLKPLNWEDVNDLILIGKMFGGDQEKNMDKIDNETIERMKNVVFKTLKISYPDEPEVELRAFAAKNFMMLIPAVMNLNFATGSSDKLDKIRSKIDAGKV